MEAISDLPMIHDIDADYSPQYVKLARILRGKIESGEFKHMDAIPGASVASVYHVSLRLAYAALQMLAANRYVSLAVGVKSYRVMWDPERAHPGAGVEHAGSRRDAKILTPRSTLSTGTVHLLVLIHEAPTGTGALAC